MPPGTVRRVTEPVPFRQIRARYDDRTVTVYQAYSDQIAQPALDAGTFVEPFKRDRMTWIKPSFLWMAYRSGWARKPGQERVLRIDITREGFEWALAHSCLSHFDPAEHESEQAWKEQLQSSPVRIQWDPERDREFRPLNHRSLQIGLSGPAVKLYVDEWITAITDATELMHQVESRDADRTAERPYPLSPALTAAIAASIA